MIKALYLVAFGFEIVKPWNKKGIKDQQQWYVLANALLNLFPL